MKTICTRFDIFSSGKLKLGKENPNRVACYVIEQFCRS